MLDQELTIIFWDVQHGHSTFIKTPNNKAVFIDLGIGSYEERDKTFSPIKHSMSRNRLTTISKVIITHPHLDHIDDILSLDCYTVGNIYYPTGIDTKELIANASKSTTNAIVRADRVKKFTKNHDITKQYSGLNRRVTRFTVDEVYFTLFRALNQGSNLNNWSILTVVEYLDWKFVIPGDNESASFKELFNIPGFVDAISDAEILLAPHHGRQNGFDNEFMEYVQPDVVIISDSQYHQTSVPEYYRKYADGYDCYNRNSGNYNVRKVLSTHNDGVILLKCGIDKNDKCYRITYG